MEIVPGPEWEDLLDVLLREKGVALLLGATDSGKSTLARYLAEGLVSAGLRVCLVDADVGQSSLGLPGTICEKVFSVPEEFADFTPDKMSFLGVFNPAERLPLMIEESRRMAAIGREEAQVTLVDTTGLVSGEIGRALKGGKLRAIGPQQVIAVQRQDEVEHILALVEVAQIHRIKTSSAAKIRKREERIRYRNNKLKAYFRRPLEEFVLTDIEFSYNGRAFRPREADFTEGTIVGLNHGHETGALGVLTEVVGGSVAVSTPVQSIKRVNRVVFGDVSL